MKIKSLLEMINSSKYDEFAIQYRKLLGYDKDTAFYQPHPDTNSLIEYINGKLKFPLEESYIEFMKESNGCKLVDTYIYSFKHEEQQKDTLFVNFDKATREKFAVSESAFIAGAYQDNAIIYEKASVIFNDESLPGCVWAIYSPKHKRCIEPHEIFLEMLEFLIEDRIDFFEED